MLLSLKDKSILMPATATWMNLEAITLSGISQSEGFHSSEALRALRFRDGRWGGGCQGLGEGEGESLLKRHSYSFTKKRVWRRTE